MAAYSIISWVVGGGIDSQSQFQYVSTNSCWAILPWCKLCRWIHACIPTWETFPRQYSAILSHARLFVCFWMNESFEFVLFNLSRFFTLSNRNVLGLLQKKSTKRSLDYANIYLQTIETTFKSVLVIITFKIQLPVINIKQSEKYTVFYAVFLPNIVNSDNQVI